MGTENTNDGSGTPSVTGGAGGAGAKPDSGNSNTETVSKESFDQVSADMHRFKKEAKDAKDALAAKETETATKNGDYQKLYETEKTKVVDLSKQLKDVITFNSDTHRLNEVKAAAIGAGLRKEAVRDLELLDLAELPVELTNRNRYIVNGVSTFVEGLKTSKPHWFQNAAAPNINAGGGAPPPSTGKISPMDVAQAELDYRSKKISYGDYIKKHEAYVSQQKTDKKAS